MTTWLGDAYTQVCHVTADWPEENVLGHVAQFEEQMEMEMMNPAAIAAEGGTSAATSAADKAATDKAATDKAAADKAAVAQATARPKDKAAPAAAAAAAAQATLPPPASPPPPPPPAASTLPPSDNEHPSIRGLANGAQVPLWIPEIIFSNLELLDLRYHQGLHCNTSAATCPTFSPCASSRRQASPISACSSDPPLVDREHVVSTPPLNHASDGSASNGAAAAAASAVPPYPYNVAAVQTQASFDEAVAEPFAAQVRPAEKTRRKRLAGGGEASQSVSIPEMLEILLRHLKSRPNYTQMCFRGAVFDATYYYRHGLFCRSCPLDAGMYTGGTTTVYVFDHLVSLAYWNGPNFYHTMLEVMPSLLFLRPFLLNATSTTTSSSSSSSPSSSATISPIPVVVRQLQELYTHLFALVDVPESSLHIHIIPDDTLYFVRRLYLPAQAQCGRPSAALVTHLRDKYLVPKAVGDASASGAGNDGTGGGTGSGVNGSLSSVGDGSGNGSLPSDWIVVVGQRDTTRRIVGRSQLLQELYNIFLGDRIVVSG
ncbi:unnamed protein product [Closterium sp. NIES-53]